MPITGSGSRFRVKLYERSRFTEDRDGLGRTFRVAYFKLSFEHERLEDSRVSIWGSETNGDSKSYESESLAGKRVDFLADSVRLDSLSDSAAPACQWRRAGIQDASKMPAQIAS